MRKKNSSKRAQDRKWLANLRSSLIETLSGPHCGVQRGNRKRYAGSPMRSTFSQPLESFEMINDRCYLDPGTWQCQAGTGHPGLDSRLLSPESRNG
jgi:hypothetical protein